MVVVDENDVVVSLVDVNLNIDNRGEGGDYDNDDNLMMWW